MSEQIAIVTGATSGIGTETARELLKRGWRVGIVSRNPVKGKETVAQLAVLSATPATEPDTDAARA